MRHASARNIIERIFGILKKRFRILMLSPHFSLDAQARIPAALAALHNFIHTHDTQEGDIPDDTAVSRDDNPEYQGQPIISIEGHQGQLTMNMREMRDRIAQDMWEDYQCILTEQSALQVQEDEGDTETEGQISDDDG